MSAVERLAAARAVGIPDPASATEALTELLDLPAVGRRVTGGRIVGSGPSASADIRLDDGTVVTFDTLRDMAKPGELMLAVGIACGAQPTLKAADARRAVILLRALGELQETATNDTLAADWGLAYLADTDYLGVDLNDQAARYAAFARLRDVGADVSNAITTRGNIAAATVTLVDFDGTRYVRAGWFYAYAKQHTNIAESLIAQRMRRVGWGQRGSQGRVKATAPGGLSEPLIWTFFTVADGWETQAVNAGEHLNARESETSRARERVHRRSPVHPTIDRAA